MKSSVSVGETVAGEVREMITAVSTEDYFKHWKRKGSAGNKKEGKRKGNLPKAVKEGMDLEIVQRKYCSNGMNVWHPLPSQFMCWNPQLPCDGIQRGLWEVIR